MSRIPSHTIENSPEAITSFLGLTVFTAYFCHYANTPADLPTPALAATAE